MSIIFPSGGHSTARMLPLRTPFHDSLKYKLHLMMELLARPPWQILKPRKDITEKAPSRNQVPSHSGLCKSTLKPQYRLGWGAAIQCRLIRARLARLTEPINILAFCTSRSFKPFFLSNTLHWPYLEVSRALITSIFNALWMIVASFSIFILKWYSSIWPFWMLSSAKNCALCSLEMCKPISQDKCCWYYWNYFNVLQKPYKYSAEENKAMSCKVML